MTSRTWASPGELKRPMTTDPPSPRALIRIFDMEVVVARSLMSLLEQRVARLRRELLETLAGPRSACWWCRSSPSSSCATSPSLSARVVGDRQPDRHRRPARVPALGESRRDEIGVLAQRVRPDGARA